MTPKELLDKGVDLIGPLLFVAIWGFIAVFMVLATLTFLGVGDFLQ